MAIRIGADPIGWSNDDLTEIGGATPRATCHAEAREAGVSAWNSASLRSRRPTPVAYASRAALI